MDRRTQPTNRHHTHQSVRPDVRTIVVRRSLSCARLGRKECTGYLPFPALLLNSRATLGGPCRGAEWSGARAEWSGVERMKRTKRSGAERSGVERRGERSQAERSGVKRSGAEWSGVERSGVETSREQSVETAHEYVAAGRHWQRLLYISPGRRRHATGQHGSGSGRYRSTW